MITRVFDTIYHQKNKFSRPDAFNNKVKGTWVNYSTQQALDIINELSLGLLQLGIAKDDKIAIISSNRPEWNFVDLGMQQIGAVSVPMYPTITVDDYKYIFNDAQVKIIFVESKDLFQKATLASQGLDVKIFSFEKLEGVEHWTKVQNLGKNQDVSQLESHKAAVFPEDLLTLIYTSGTTGRPKGVMLTHSNIVSNVIAVRPVLHVEEGKNKCLSFLPLCHIFERTAVYFYMYSGTGIYYAESMETIGDNLKEVQPNVFTTVPRLLEKVYDKIIAKGHDLTGIKKSLFFWAVNLGLRYEPHKDMGFFYDLQLKIANKLIFSKWREALGGNVSAIVVGSAALQARLARVFWAAQIRVCEGYGLTETSPVIAANLPHAKDNRVGTVGVVIEKVEVKIAEDGEILCKGPNIMKGYYNQPELTAEVIKDGWFHTGDIGEFVEGRFLKITDRKKEMFKTSGGKYIAPQVMENKFKESVFIEQLMVTGSNRKFPAALIVPAFDYIKEWCKLHNIDFVSNEQIIKHPVILKKFQDEVDKYNENFGNWEKIKKFTLLPTPWVVDSGEVTPTLKLKRKSIESKYHKEIEEIYAS